MCVVYYHRANDRKICPSFYRQDLLGFDSLSRDWLILLLILDPDYYILNLDIHNFSLDYPWVMTPLSNNRVMLVCI